MKKKSVVFLLTEENAMKQRFRPGIIIAVIYCLTMLLTACSITPDSITDDSSKNATTTEMSPPAATEPSVTAPDSSAYPATETMSSDKMAEEESTTQVGESNGSTEIPPESSDIKPWKGKVNERMLPENQGDITQTQLVYCWNQEGAGEKLSGSDAVDFYYHDLSGTYMLQGDGQLLTGYSNWPNQSWDLSCTHPRRLLVNMETKGLDIDSDWEKAFYVLCDEGVIRIPQTDVREDLEMERRLLIPLPEGVGPDDVMDLVLHDNSGKYSWYTRNIYPLLITYQNGNYMLDPTNLTWRSSTYGYQIIWMGEETLEVRTSGICWRITMPRQQVWVLKQPTDEELVLCTKAEEESFASVYYFKGEDCQICTVDMGDWIGTPNCFAKSIYNKTFILAPKENTVELQQLNP